MRLHQNIHLDSRGGLKYIVCVFQFDSGKGSEVTQNAQFILKGLVTIQNFEIPYYYDVLCWIRAPHTPAFTKPYNFHRLGMESHSCFLRIFTLCKGV